MSFFQTLKFEKKTLSERKEYEISIRFIGSKRKIPNNKIKNDNKEKSQTIITTTNIINIKENGFFMEFDNIKKHHLVKNGTA